MSESCSDFEPLRSRLPSVSLVGESEFLRRGKKRTEAQDDTNICPNGHVNFNLKSFLSGVAAASPEHQQKVCACLRACSVGAGFSNKLQQRATEMLREPAKTEFLLMLVLQLMLQRRPLPASTPQAFTGDWSCFGVWVCGVGSGRVACLGFVPFGATQAIGAAAGTFKHMLQRRTGCCARCSCCCSSNSSSIRC